MIEIKIGSVIKRQLWNLRKTLKEVSRETGLPYSTLHTWLENRQPKDILKAQLLADYLNISLEELLFDRGPPVRPESRGDVNRDDTSNTFEISEGRFEILIRKME